MYLMAGDSPIIVIGTSAVIVWVRGTWRKSTCKIASVSGWRCTSRIKENRVASKALTDTVTGMLVPASATMLLTDAASACRLRESRPLP